MGLPRYKQLVERLAADIRSGRCASGTRLPTHRALAAKEGLALATATRVYTELAAMGLVSGESGRGTFVRYAALPAGLGVDQPLLGQDMIDLNFNNPNLSGQGHLLRDALRELAMAGELDSLLCYQPHGGRLRERAMVAGYLADQGLQVGAEQVLLVNGAQHGLAVAMMAMLQPGDAVAVDALTYPGFKVLADTLHLTLLPVPQVAGGPDLDALAQLCRQRKVRAVFTMPTLHNPLGWVMPAAQRQALVALARQYGLLLIEDAAYAFLVEGAPPPLAALAPELTVYVSGFSKSVATGLRVGYVVAPPPWRAAMERVIRATAWNTPGVMCALVCGWLADGTVARLQAQKRQDAARRQTMAAAVLAGMPYVSHPASYFLWLPLPPAARAEPLVAELRQHGVAVSPAAPFACTAHVPQAVRLALGSPGLPALQQALQLVRQVLGNLSD